MDVCLHLNFKPISVHMGCLHFHKQQLKTSSAQQFVVFKSKKERSFLNSVESKRQVKATIFNLVNVAETRRDTESFGHLQSKHDP